MLLIILALTCSSWSPIDQDGDGLSALDGDCWDRTDGPTDSLTGADIYPGAPDAPYDGIDTNCDGVDDYDVDGDGYVPDEYTDLVTLGVDGSGSLPGGDCVDTDAAIHPDATELCNVIDDDCDGLVDNDAVDATDWYADADDDVFGDPDAVTRACDAPSGAVADATDCDDVDPDVNPDAVETCNGVDDDCDGLVDEDGDQEVSWYVDQDGDGYADDDAVATIACAAPTADSVLVLGDCDDTNDSVHPDATETCDGRDQDCDGVVDNDATGSISWYPDADRDGYGQTGVDAVVSCSPPDITGWADNTQDCDDTASNVHPGVDETCDGQDEDCDGSIDEDAIDAVTAWTDADGDGYGDPTTETTVCTLTSDQVSQAGDCDDSSSAVNPDATELCNDIDDDCDGVIDTDATDRVTAYTDADGDGYGDPTTETTVCTLTSDQVSQAGDCDDSSDTVNPDGTEVCNDVDDDCNDVVDDSPTDGLLAYSDLDGDGFGDPLTVDLVCGLESWQTTDDRDCDDDAADVSPDGTEVCNGVDDDCNDVVDDSPTDGTTFYSDVDGDGYGDTTTGIVACEAEFGQVTDNTDCDDTDATINPAATEVCNGVDDNCDANIDPDYYSSDFSGDPSADIQINGDAEWRDGIIRLTDKHDDEYGSAFLKTTIPGDSWQVSFTASIWDKDRTGADGMTFAFLDESVDATWVTTTTGGDLGVSGAAGWAFELDTYDNGSSYGDPNDEHVALIRADDMATIAYEADPPNLDGGDWLTVLVTYDAGDVDVSIDGAAMISSSISGTAPDNWRLGFTGATGGAHEKHGVDDLWIGCP